LCRYYLAVPRSAALVLYASGFRHGRTSVRFEDVASLRGGRVDSYPMQFMANLNEVFAQFRRMNRRMAERREISTRASVTVVLKDGRAWSMNSVLLRFEKADVERFFAAVADRYPELTLIPWEAPAVEVEEVPEFHDPALGDAAKPGLDPVRTLPSGRSLI